MAFTSRCRITLKQVPENRPGSTGKAWVVPHLPRGRVFTQFSPHFQLPWALVWWHRPVLTWTTWAETQLIYLCVYSVGIDIWSRHAERASSRAVYLIHSRCLLFNKSPPASLSPLWQTGSLQGLVETRHVQMEPSGGWSCALPFSWSFAKGLLWLGVSDS